MPRAISRCPGCGEPVSQFAAGCAICGTDLESARAEVAARRAAIPAPLRGGLPWLDDDAVRILVALILALGSPLLGLVLATFFAVQVGGEGRSGPRNALIVIALLSVLLLFVPIWIWGGVVAGI